MAAFAATPARFAFLSPRRLPILERIVRHATRITGIATNRTEVAIPREYGAWKVLATVVISTDCVANGIGPRLQGFTQWWIPASLSLLTSWQQLRLFAISLFDKANRCVTYVQQAPRTTTPMQLDLCYSEYINGDSIDITGTDRHHPCSTTPKNLMRSNIVAR